MMTCDHAAYKESDGSHHNAGIVQSPKPARETTVDVTTQLVTIAAVILGSLTTYLVSYLTERSQHQRQLRFRWDERKLDAYAAYVGRVRSCIYAAVLLYQARQNSATADHKKSELVTELTKADSQRVLAFERVMLLADESVIEVAHAINEALAVIDWTARGIRTYAEDEWRQLHERAFAEINRFHKAARLDLQVHGRFADDQHSARGLIRPDTRP